MFQQRGISLDSNLWPDYDLDLQLQRMAARGMLKPGSVRRVLRRGLCASAGDGQSGSPHRHEHCVPGFAYGARRAVRLNCGHEHLSLLRRVRTVAGAGNVAAMLRPSGYLLSNDKLAAGGGSGLDLVMTTEIPMTGEPVVTDYIFCYRHGS
jgi:hypothetical protein